MKSTEEILKETFTRPMTKSECNFISETYFRPINGVSVNFKESPCENTPYVAFLTSYGSVGVVWDLDTIGEYDAGEYFSGQVSVSEFVDLLNDGIETWRLDRDGFFTVAGIYSITPEIEFDPRSKVVSVCGIARGNINTYSKLISIVELMNQQCPVKPSTAS